MLVELREKRARIISRQELEKMSRQVRFGR